MNHAFVGTAGWSLRKEHLELFPESGTHLERYASLFNLVEINSSFYRPHRRSTYQRWATSTPDTFAFSAKLPKQITHGLRLKNATEQVETFLDQVSGLGDKLHALLVQLPPSYRFDVSTAHHFFTDLRSRVSSALVCEPRHATWFTTEPGELFKQHNVSRVIADLKMHVDGDQQAGTLKQMYFRWHGSPRTYYSKYNRTTLQALAARILQAGQWGSRVYCIFDNTAEGAATENALELTKLLSAAPQDAGQFS